VRVNRYNYPSQFPNGIGTLISDMEQMILKGNYILTEEVAAFERAFAQYLNTAFAKGVNSGTDALAVTFAALGLQPGEEVITQANTFNGTVAAILMVGATPVLVDADEHSYLMDVEQIESVITSRTRAIVPVHLYGKPTPMEPILSIASKYGLFVVEDAAQAHGAKWNGRAVGRFGVAGCFSFHPSKNLAAAGDGGIIVTSDEKLARAIDEVRSFGQRGQNNHVRPGFNSKLDALQARVLQEKLPHLDGWNQERRRIADEYRDRLGGLPLVFQVQTKGEEHVYHLFQIRTSQRDALLQHLVSTGVDAVIRYPQPIHLQASFARFAWRAGQFPQAEALSKELLCLPLRPDLTESEISYVCNSVRDFFATSVMRYGPADVTHSINAPKIECAMPECADAHLD